LCPSFIFYILISHHSGKAHCLLDYIIDIIYISLVRAFCLWSCCKERCFTIVSFSSFGYPPLSLHILPSPSPPSPFEPTVCYHLRQFKKLVANDQCWASKKMCTWEPFLGNKEKQVVPKRKTFSVKKTLSTMVSLIYQYRHIKIQPSTIDLSMRLWGINPTNSVVILQSLMLRSTVLGWILIKWNWSIIYMWYSWK